MSADLEWLIDILEVSVRRNGKDHPLTVGHLLNICKLAQRHEESDDEMMNEATGFDPEFWKD